LVSSVVPFGGVASSGRRSDAPFKRVSGAGVYLNGGARMLAGWFALASREHYEQWCRLIAVGMTAALVVGWRVTLRLL